MNEQINENTFSIFLDPIFKFDSIAHQYTYGIKPLKSVTQWIGEFHSHFDEDYWAERKSIETGKTKEEIIMEWHRNRDRACDLGTAVHLYIEERIKGIEITPITDDEVLERTKKFEEVYEKRLSNLKPIRQELKVFSEELGIAGTIDALFEINGELWILDWKTNSKYNRDSDKNYQKLKEPFQDLWDNQENIYSLQLSLYDLILELKGIHIKNKAIIWIPKDGPAKIYKTKDLKPRLKKYFGI